MTWSHLATDHRHGCSAGAWGHHGVPRVSAALRHWLLAGLLMGLLTALSGCGTKSDAEWIKAAQQLAEQGDPAAAAIELKALLQKKPSSAEARQVLGSTLLAMGDSNGAVVELLKAQELKLSNDKVQPPLARALYAQGKFTQVVEQFRNQTLADPLAASNLKTTVALAQARLGRTAEAKASLQSVLAQRPKYGPALVAVARLTAAEGNHAGALEGLNKALAAHPKYLDALLLKGEVLATGPRDFEGARAAFQQAVAAVPTSATAHAARIANNIQFGKGALAKSDLAEMQKLLPKSPQTRYFTALMAFGDRDYKRAKELADELEQWAPNDLRVLQLLAALHLQNNELAAAQARLVQASRLSTSAGPARAQQAQVDMKQGQPQKALEVLAPLLQGTAPDPHALTIAAQAHQQMGDKNKAEALFAQALQLQPDNPALKATLALAELAQGHTASGFAKLDEISRQDASNVADLAAISARLQAGVSPALFKDLDRLEQKEPNKPLVHDLRARALLKSSDTAGARRSFEQALKLDPGYFPAAAGLATLDKESGNFKAALDRFAPLLKANPKHLRARMAVVELKMASGADRAESERLLRSVINDLPRELEPRLVLGEKLLAAGRVDDAVSVAQDATSAFPILTRAFDLLGRSQMARRDWVQAAAAFKKMAGLDTTSALPHRRLAELNVKRNDHPEALRNLQRARVLAPSDRSLMADLFSVALKAKQFDVARALAKDLQKDPSNRVLGLLLEGDIEAHQKNWAGAIAWYQRCLQLEPNASKAALKLYDAQLALQKPQEAQATLQTWLQAHPKDIDLRTYQGDKALAKKDYAQAEVHFREVLAIAPQHASSLNNVAWLMARQGKPGASDYAQRAVALAPGLAPFQDSLALALLNDGQVERALEVQSKLVAKMPQAPGFRLTLAKIQLQAGHKREARAELGKLAALGGKFAEQDEVANLLKTAATR